MLDDRAAGSCANIFLHRNKAKHSSQACNGQRCDWGWRSPLQHQLLSRESQIAAPCIKTSCSPHRRTESLEPPPWPSQSIAFRFDPLTCGILCIARSHELQVRGVGGGGRGGKSWFLCHLRPTSRKALGSPVVPFFRLSWGSWCAELY